MEFHQLKTDLIKPLNLREGRENTRNNQLGLNLTSRAHSYPPIYAPNPGIYHSFQRLSRRAGGRKKEKDVVEIWLDQIQDLPISKLCIYATNIPGKG